MRNLDESALKTEAFMGPEVH